MLTRVDVINERGESLSLPLQGNMSGYQVKDIEGLDPGTASLSDSPTALLPGSDYITGHREPRDIVLHLGYDEDFVTNTVESLRRNLYRFFMPTTAVRLRFFFDGQPFVDISGVVKTCESALFTKDPEMAVTLVAHRPDFSAVTETVIAGVSQTDLTVPYEGTVPVGYFLEATFDRDVPYGTLTLSHTTGGVTSSVTLASAFGTGDTVKLNTVPGDKYVRIFRMANAEEVSGLPYLESFGAWPVLRPGQNVLTLGLSGLPIPFTVRYTARYGGL